MTRSSRRKRAERVSSRIFHGESGRESKSEERPLPPMDGGERGVVEGLDPGPRELRDGGGIEGARLCVEPVYIWQVML